jgi:hypothetical protein
VNLEAALAEQGLWTSDDGLEALAAALSVRG